MIQAIETEYAGCRFRSRLEARWAVFFDALKIEWRYEPEGFEVSSGRYLPDFYLPTFGKWIEVKPGVGQITHDQWQRMQDFGNEVAMPNDKFSIIFSIPGPNKRPAPFIWSVVWTGPLPGEVWPTDPDLVDSCGHVFMGFTQAVWAVGDDTPMAMTAARSARFGR